MIQKADLTDVSCAVCSITFALSQGKEGVIDFTAGSELLVAKAKNGHLAVVSRPTEYFGFVSNYRSEYID